MKQVQPQYVGGPVAEAVNTSTKKKKKNDKIIQSVWKIQLLGQQYLLSLQQCSLIIKFSRVRYPCICTNSGFNAMQIAAG
jgi:hypothetical protein